MPDLSTLVRQHAERYDTGDPSDAVAYDVLTKAAEVLAFDLDRPGMSTPDQPEQRYIVIGRGWEITSFRVANRLRADQIVRVQSPNALRGVAWRPGDRVVRLASVENWSARARENLTAFLAAYEACRP